jgi:hypothetical protein
MYNLLFCYKLIELFVTECKDNKLGDRVIKSYSQFNVATAYKVFIAYFYHYYL